MVNFPRHVYFERRRLTVAGLLAFVAGYALYAHIPAVVHGMPLPVFTGLIYAVVVVLAAAATAYLMPKLRRLIDAVALTRLAFAVWVVLAHGQAVAASPTATAAIVVGSAIALLHLATWLDKLSRQPAAMVWIATTGAELRSLAAWLDNAAVRGNATYPASFATRPANAPMPAGLATA